MKLNKEIESCIMAWAENATRWGLNRTEAQIHALLFLVETPLTMEDIAETLGVARSNVSNSLKALLNWRIIKAINVRGIRRKHYVALKDVWEMFRSVVYEQKKRNIDPFIGMIKDTKEKLEQSKSRDAISEHALKQVTQMTEFLDTSNYWFGQLQSMSTETIRQYMKVGNKVLKLAKLI